MSLLDVSLTAYSQTAADYVQPTVGSTVVMFLQSAGWVPVGSTVFVAGGGYYTCTAIGHGQSIVARNLGTVGNASASTIVRTNARCIAVGQPGATDESGGGIATFAAISNLVAFDATLVPNGGLSKVVTPNDLYEWFSSPSAGIIAATDGARVVQPTTPSTGRWVRKGAFRATFYVDPTFPGASNGCESNPYPSHTTAIAAAVAQGLTSAVFIQAPGTTSTENITFPTSGNWEILCEQDGPGTFATIAGNIICNCTPQSTYVFSNMIVTGTITGATAATSGSFLTLRRSIVNGAINLTSTGGFWFCSCLGEGAWSFFGLGGGTAAVSVVGGILADSFHFSGTLTFNSVSDLRNCTLAGNIVVNAPGGLGLVNCGFAGLSTITGSGGVVNVDIDGFTHAQAVFSSVTLVSAQYRIRNDVNPSGIQQAGASNGDFMGFSGGVWTHVPAPTAPFKATFYVDPTFVGTSNGSQSSPFPSHTTAIAAAPSTGALLIQAPLTNSTENVTFPTTGDWEIQCQDNGRATITGNVVCTSVAQCSYRLTNMVVTGNVSGDATSSSGNFLVLTNMQVLGAVTLTGSGSGFWFALLRGAAPTLFSLGGTVGGAFSVFGNLFANRWTFGGTVAFTGVGSEIAGCRFSVTGISLGGGSVNVTNSVFTVAPTFTGPGSIAMDGYSHAKAAVFALAGGATLTIANDVDPSGIIQAGATGTNTQALMWSGTAWAPHTVSTTATGLSIASEAQGDIIYRNATTWVRLPAGTAGQALVTAGAGANPSWSTAFGDGSETFNFNGENISTNTFRFQCVGATRFIVENLSVQIVSTPNLRFVGPGGTVKIGPDQVGGTSCQDLKLFSQGSNASGTFTCGALTLAGGDAILAATGTVTGGSATLTGGRGNTDASNGNVALCGPFAPSNWQAMSDGVFVHEAGAAPTGNPTGGFFIYIDPSDHKLKARGPSGTVTTIANP